MLDWHGLMAGSGVTNMLAGSTAIVATYATLDTRTLNTNGAASNAGGGFIYLQNGGTFNNHGTFNVVSNGQFSRNGAATPGTFNNLGVFNKPAGLDFSVWQGLLFNNSGTVNVEGAPNFAMAGGQYRQTGGTLNLLTADSTLWTNTLAHLLEGGVVRGIGNITSQGSASTNNTGAEISPGVAPASAGTLTINGPYTQSGSGRLNIELGGTAPGTQYDRLVVNGAANLGGTLNVSAINNYTPPVGSEFTIITHQSRTGTFSSTTGGQYAVTYNPTDTRITVTGSFGCAPGVFSDVPSDHPFYPYVTCLVDREIMSGYADCTFRPGNNLTRGQLSKIVSNAANFQEPHSAQTFEDVAADHPFYIWIERLASRGIIGGYACGGAGEPCVPPGNRPYFRSGNNVTRGQTSKIVAIAANPPLPHPDSRHSRTCLPTTPSGSG
jgi:hypothetical protein